MRASILTKICYTWTGGGGGGGGGGGLQPPSGSDRVYQGRVLNLKNNY